MKAYKGFNKDMTCRGFQYEEGEIYETDEVKCCETGFHACKDPLNCFRYYLPRTSEYHEVECEGEIDDCEDDTKFACTKIKIGKKLSIFDIVNESFRVRKKNFSDKFEAGKVSDSTKPYGIAHIFGYKSISCSTGAYGISSSVGFCSCSASTSSRGISVVEGEGGISSTTGSEGIADLKGKFGISCTTGICGSACVENANCIAVSWGAGGRAKGVLGSYLVLADWEEDGLRDAQIVKVDGEEIKADTWYTMVNGEIVEA